MQRTAAKITSLSYSSNASSTTIGASSPSACCNDGGGLALPLQRPGVHTIDFLAAFREELSEQLDLLAAEIRKLIVVIGAERCLSVTNEVQGAH